MPKSEKSYGPPWVIRCHKSIREKIFYIKKLESAKGNKLTNEEVLLLLTDSYHELASIKHDIDCNTKKVIGIQ